MRLEECGLLYVSFLTFESNQAEVGGAIYTSHVEDKMSEFKGCVVHDNTAVDGGALYFQSSQGIHTVTSSVFVGNVAGTLSVYTLTATMRVRVAHR